MTSPKKNPEDYRLLAERFREAARKAPTEQQRANLLAMARKWDLLAGYLQHKQAFRGIG
jgi:hypothetical protein